MCLNNDKDNASASPESTVRSDENEDDAGSTSPSITEDEECDNNAEDVNHEAKRAKFTLQKEIRAKKDIHRTAAAQNRVTASRRRQERLDLKARHEEEVKQEQEKQRVLIEEIDALKTHKNSFEKLLLESVPTPEQT